MIKKKKKALNIYGPVLNTLKQSNIEPKKQKKEKKKKSQQQKINPNVNNNNK